jgi:uncharacterized protein YodC (DUF2158 family)
MMASAGQADRSIHQETALTRRKRAWDQMATNFKPGDIVQLKTRGPVMTVESVSGDDVTCRCQDGGDRATYDALELKAAPQRTADKRD